MSRNARTARRFTCVRIAAIDRAAGRWRDPMAHAPTPRRRLFPGGLLVLLGLCWMALATPPAAAQSVEQFYKGRTITLYVASAPGGINDLTARLIAKHMPNFLAGRPTIVVQNLSGANGLALANRLAVNSEKDGSVIAILERGTP